VLTYKFFKISTARHSDYLAVNDLDPETGDCFSEEVLRSPLARKWPCAHTFFEVD